jgi:hypothetical protein
MTEQMQIAHNHSIALTVKPNGKRPAVKMNKNHRAPTYATAHADRGAWATLKIGRHCWFLKRKSGRKLSGGNLDISPFVSGQRIHTH